MSFFRRQLFLSYYRLTGRADFAARVAEWDHMHWREEAERKRIVDEHLQRLLTHAARTVPYYRDMVETLRLDLSREEIRRSLARMPVLSKAIIREEGPRLCSDRPGEKVLSNTSGGSTGEPVRLLQDRAMRYAVTLNKYTYLRWLGYDFGDGHLHIWGVPRRTFGEPTPLRDRIYQALHHEKYLNCYEISDSLFSDWHEAATRMRPAVIEGYADALNAFARWMLADGRRIDPPKGAVSSAGVLHDEMAVTIQKALGCRVLNRYGSREVGDVACSCPQGKELHVSENAAMLEIVDEEGNLCAPGVEGDVLVTLFNNRTMPLIRYRIEDRAAWAEGPCICGRTSHRLARVCGRESDYLWTHSGKRINGTALTTLLYPVEGIARFQYVQRAPGEVDLSIELRPGADREQIKQQIAPLAVRLERMLENGRVQVRLVDAIAPTASGKYRYILNEVRELPTEALTGSGAHEG